MRRSAGMALFGLCAACSEYTVQPTPEAPFPGDPLEAPAAFEAHRGDALQWDSFEGAGDPIPPADDPAESDPPETATAPPENDEQTVGYTEDSEGNAGEDPAGDEPAGDDPIADEPAADDPIADEPAGDDPIADDPAGDDPIADDPVDGDLVPGRIQGHIDIADDVGVNSHIYCDAAWPDNALRIEIGDSRFVLDVLDQVVCSDEPGREPGGNSALFDTITGVGTGTLDGFAAEIWFVIADGGEPAEHDVLAFEVIVGSAVWAASGPGIKGNLQALPPAGPL